MVYSVKIIHDELSGRAYRLLADFLRLVGIHVHDCTSKAERTAEGYDAVYAIMDGSKEEELRLKELYPNIIFAYEIDSNANAAVRKKYLDSSLVLLIDNLKDSNPLSQKEQDELFLIAGIFVDYQLLYHRNAYVFSSSCYSGQSGNGGLDVVNTLKEAQKAYANAMIQLRDICGKNLTRYGYYAQMSLARSINETCSLLGQRFVFDTGLCLDMLDSVLKKDAAFNNVHLLKAFFAEMDQLHIFEAENYYRAALEDRAGKAYMSYPTYRMGRYYEKKLLEEDKAADYYAAALELNSREYRAIYKKMLRLRDEGEYVAAIKLCDEICNILLRKETANYLQPREYEYLVKAYSEKANLIMMESGNIDKYGQVMAELNRLYKQMEQPNEMYQWIFGNKSEIFIRQTYEWLKGSLL